MSSLIGKTVKQSYFRTRYGASVLAVYREGKRVIGNVGDAVLQAGDTLMLLSSDLWKGADFYSHDFYYVSHSREITLYRPWRMFLVIGSLVAMVSAAFIGIPIMLASLSVVSLFFITRCIRFRTARKSVTWNVLLLIASAFSMATALQTTGVANYFAEKILPIVGTNPYVLVATIYIVTMIVTEFVTNTAAAMMIFPIAVQIGRLAGFETVNSIKAIGVTVAIAASFSFATPIGYQTNTIVYGQGGYKFFDYMKVGIPLSITLFLLASFLIPRIWPLVVL